MSLITFTAIQTSRYQAKFSPRTLCTEQKHQAAKVGKRVRSGYSEFIVIISHRPVGRTLRWRLNMYHVPSLKSLTIHVLARLLPSAATVQPLASRPAAFSSDEESDGVSARAPMQPEVTTR